MSKKAPPKPPVRRDRVAELEERVKVLEKAVQEVYEAVRAQKPPEMEATFSFRQVKSEEGVRLIEDPWTGGAIVVDRQGVQHPYSKRSRAEQVYEYMRKKKVGEAPPPQAGASTEQPPSGK